MLLIYQTPLDTIFMNYIPLFEGFTNPQTYLASLSFCQTICISSYNEVGCIMGKLDLMSFARWVSLRGTPFQFIYANINLIPYTIPESMVSFQIIIKCSFQLALIWENI